MRPARSEHPTRPAGYFSFHLPLWQAMFDSVDPAYTRAALDVRYPFLDLRVLGFLMRVPVIPWCRDKYLFRYAFRSDLPGEVFHRQKTPLQGNPYQAKVLLDGLPPIRQTQGLYRYGDPTKVSLEEAASSPITAEATLRFAALSEWLYRLEKPVECETG